MAGKTRIGGTAYDISGGRTRISGTAYTIAGGKTRIGGTSYDISFGTKIGTLPVGSSVYLNVNGTKTEFFVVHQGRPSTLYDVSCDGTWLLMRNILEKRSWDDTFNDYANSQMHAYLNESVLGLFDPDIQAAISQAKIPYRPGSGKGTSIAGGASGLPVKLFLLSCTEVGMSYPGEILSGEGAKLSYFQATTGWSASPLRIAQYNGVPSGWWMRTPYINQYASYDQVMATRSEGGAEYISCKNSYGLRPALILPSSFTIKE